MCTPIHGQLAVYFGGSFLLGYKQFKLELLELKCDPPQDFRE